MGDKYQARRTRRFCGFNTTWIDGTRRRIGLVGAGFRPLHEEKGEAWERLAITHP